MGGGLESRCVGRVYGADGAVRVASFYCNIWYLDATFPNRWIGRDDPTPWPPRSPDIAPLDFFLWVYVKDKVFSTPVPDITNLKARITDAFATITEHMLEKLIID